MRFASIAEVKNQLSAVLTRARKRKESVIVTHHGTPYAVIQPLFAADLETLEWKVLGQKRLAEAFAADDDRLYDYL